MISTTAGTSASAVAAARGAARRRRSPNSFEWCVVSSFTGRSRCRETCPTSVCACIGIHYPRPLCARRCRLAASRVPFSERSFLVHGETSAAAARRWTAAGTPLLVRGRCSPFEVLPRLPITRASFCLSYSSRRFSVPRPYTSRCRSLSALRLALPPRFFSHLLSLPSLLHAPVFYPPFRPLASLSPGFDLHHPVVLVPTSYIPWSVLTHSTFPSQLFSFRSYQINVFSISIKLYFQQYLISDN